MLLRAVYAKVSVNLIGRKDQSVIAAIVLSVLHALLLIEDDHIVSSGGSNTVVWPRA